MFILEKAIISAVRTGQAQKRELVNELLRTNTVLELAEKLADYLVEYDEDKKPITVSQEEFERITSLFRIRGLRADGTFENRGKKKE